MADKHDRRDGKVLDLIGKVFDMGRGRPMPLGATIKREGINFAVFSRHATEVSLVLFAAGDQIRKGAALNALQIAELLCDHS